jgi:hypothetical protein
MVQLKNKEILEGTSLIRVLNFGDAWVVAA